VNPRELLLASFRAAVAAADPTHALPGALPAPPGGRTIVVGAGKAAASMARAVETAWPPDRPLEGCVVTRYGHNAPTRRIQVIEAGHPRPDAAGEAAARQMLALVRQAEPTDLVLALISGGGSALLALPAQGITMADLRTTTARLLDAGVPIEDINIVRKHLSAIAGGQLAAASRAPVIALIISDVTGDDPADIASGPCAPDPSTFRDALDVLKLWRIDAPAAATMRFEAGARGEIDETPKPGSAQIAHAENRVIATARQSLAAGARTFETAGMNTVSLGDRITGEAREVGKVLGGIALEAVRGERPWGKPIAIVSGGECTVTVHNGGRGGRNCEFLLSLALALNAQGSVYAIAADTDGIDGTEDNAGALIYPDTLARARQQAANDAYSFFSALGDLVVTGPTLTNVNDYRAILVA
jgi:glycerate 2-kinase